MARRPLRILLVATLVAALCATGPIEAGAQSARNETPPPGPTASEWQAILQTLTDALDGTAATITAETTVLALTNLIDQELQTVCHSSPIGAITVDMATFAAKFGLTGLPAPGQQLNEFQCAQLAGAAAAQSAAANASLNSSMNKYQQEESAVTQLLQTINSVTSSIFNQLAVDIGGTQLDQASASDARTLVVSARGPRLRSLRIYFDKRLVASGRARRLKARIAWGRAKPGLHRVRVIAVDANGHRVRRTVWLLRRDDRITRLIRRSR
jgi:hypothetical protein